MNEKIITDNTIDYINRVVPYPALLEQIAEEAVELAKESLKLARVIRKENPCPELEEKVKERMIEELSDLKLCVDVCRIKPDPVCMKRKLHRWHHRIMKISAGSVENEEKS